MFCTKLFGTFCIIIRLIIIEKLPFFNTRRAFIISFYMYILFVYGEKFSPNTDKNVSYQMT